MIKGKSRSIYLVLLGCVAWIGNAVYALGETSGTLRHVSSGLVALALALFFLWHFERRYGRVRILHFLVIVFMVGWTFESLSILTGFPFGRYHYTDIMAPFVGHVPVFVLPAYLFVGYAAWSLATLLLGVRTAALPNGAVRKVPLLAAVLMTLWDFSMDPLRATVEGRWVWLEGGAYLGVPLSNFLGWFVVTWCMFQLFALFLRATPLPETPRLAADRHYWASVPLMFTSFAGEYLINPLTGHGLSRLPAGTTGLSVQDIFTSVAIVASITLVPLLLIGLVTAYGWLRPNPYAATQKSTVRGSSPTRE